MMPMKFERQIETVWIALLRVGALPRRATWPETNDRY
jgi:hypothetical protein